MTNEERWMKLMDFMRNEAFDQSGVVRIILPTYSGAHEYCTPIKDFEQIMDSEHMFLPPKAR